MSFPASHRFGVFSYHHLVAAFSVALCLFASVTHSKAVAITGLFNTGLDSGGNLLAPGAIDPHFKLTYSDDPAHPGPDAHASTPSASWVPNSATAGWLAPGATSGGALPGTYIFRLTFDLTGQDPATTAIAGAWAAANVGMIQLNGVFVPGSMNTAGAGVLTDFIVPSSAGFLSGVNTLSFVVINAAEGQTGLQVQFIPEPGTVGLLLLGMAILSGLYARRAR